MSYFLLFTAPFVFGRLVPPSAPSSLPIEYPDYHMNYIDYGGFKTLQHYQCGKHYCIVKGVPDRNPSDYPIQPVPKFVEEACANYDNFKCRDDDYEICDLSVKRCNGIVDCQHAEDELGCPIVLSKNGNVIQCEQCTHAENFRKSYNIGNNTQSYYYQLPCMACKSYNWFSKTIAPKTCINDVSWQLFAHLHSVCSIFKYDLSAMVVDFRTGLF